MINIDKSFGIFPAAMLVHGKRAEVIASNLVNQDTPGWAAKDIDYQAALQALEDNGLNNDMNMQSSEEQMNIALEHVKYRQVMQDSVDNNSVDAQLENSAYVENSMRYMAAIEFLNGRIRGIMNAIRGD
ncbi:MAG: flagellar basal body rod protein FlgB [Francisellaceae bacterium]|jgi:flagellar basal-body rod protein FlgB|nr:flagellar basal body rod protein FlgB [Francisellaceae bacterium]MBT6539555.1 flagellar basal body rod protein FlgB [Francisellaceae bacterium]